MVEQAKVLTIIPAYDEEDSISSLPLRVLPGKFEMELRRSANV